MALEHILLLIFVFSPLFGAILIFLAPSSDINSQTTLEKFFSLAGFILLFYLFMIFLQKNMFFTLKLNIPFINSEIIFKSKLEQKNLLFYIITSAILLINSILRIPSKSKRNLYQASPFILVFILYLIYLQQNFIIILPILTISIFVLFFNFAYGNSVSRGNSIFKIGIFFVSIDTLSIIFLQQKFSMINENNFLIGLLFLLPSLSRMCLPLFFPYSNLLFLNCHPKEVPLIMSFLQLSGFYLFTMVNNAGLINEKVANLILWLIPCNGLVILLFMLKEKGKKNLLFNNLIFYNSIAIFIFLFSKQQLFQTLSFALFFTNLCCFIFLSYFNQTGKNIKIINNLINQNILSTIIFAGIPGLGIGTVLWLFIANYIKNINNLSPSLLYLTFLLLTIYFLFIFFSLNKNALIEKETNEGKFSKKTYDSTIKATLITSIIIGNLIPFLTFYIITIKG